MSKKDAIEAIKNSVGVNTGEATEIFERVLSHISTEVMDNGNEIALREFGLFHRKEQLPRMARDVSRNVPAMTKHKHVLRFNMRNTMRLRIKQARIERVA